jgi:putative heme-binding domain-containing protein
MNRNQAFRALLLLLAFVLAAAQPPAPRKSGDLAQGRKRYNNQCALCHGIEGTGGRGPALNQPRLQRAVTEAELIKIIQQGIPDTEMPEFWMMTEKEVRQVAAYVRSLGRVQQVKLPGDAARGKVIYDTKGNCAACHVVRGEGGVAGPELTEIGLRRSAAYLREALLNPNATLPDGFLLVTVTTADGQRVRGLRVNEDSFSIQLRDVSQQFHSLRKAELKEIKKEFGVSTMPSYQDVFTAAELDDLIAYLASLRGER